MTSDEPDPELDPVSAEDEARITRLLSAARETAPMPADVVTRLDETLAGLAAGGGVPGSGEPGPVVPLSRLRRRRVVTLLAAAAAVVVIGGLGVGTFLDGAEPDSVSGADADSRVERGNEDTSLSISEGPDGEAPVESGAEDHKTMAGGAAGAEAYRDSPRAYVVRSRHLTRDLARIQRRVLTAPDGADYSPGDVYVPQGFTCRAVPSSRGILVGVLYDRGPAFVRFQQPMGDSQVVDVLQCGTGEPLRSTTLPTRR